MDIRKLTGDAFVDRKKVDRFSRSGETSPSVDVREGESASTAAGDKIDLSGINAGELAMVQQSYRNLNQQSLDRVRFIRQQIQNGEYNVQEALDKATGKILNDVKSVDVMSFGQTDAVLRTKPTLDKLTDEALTEISRKILRDLGNL